MLPFGITFRDHHYLVKIEHNINKYVHIIRPIHVHIKKTRTGTGRFQIPDSFARHCNAIMKPFFSIVATDSRKQVRRKMRILFL